MKKTFSAFWDVGSTCVPITYGRVYRDSLAAYLTSGTSHMILKWIPYTLRNSVLNAQGNDWKKFRFLFYHEPHYQTMQKSFCKDTQRLVCMYNSCPSMDFYTIQWCTTESGWQDGDDVTLGMIKVPGYRQMKDQDGDAGYDVFVFQPSVGLSHEMSIEAVLDRLVLLEKAIVAGPGTVVSAETQHMKSSLLSARVTIWVCYIQPRERIMFNALPQKEVGVLSPRKEVNSLQTEYAALKQALRSKLQMIYGVADPMQQCTSYVDTTGECEPMIPSADGGTSAAGSNVKKELDVVAGMSMVGSNVKKEGWVFAGMSAEGTAGDAGGDQDDESMEYI